MALTSMDLLILGADDFLRLLGRFLAVKQQVEAVADERHLR